MRYQKGQSGNPAGRPRRPDTFQALLDRELGRRWQPGPRGETRKQRIVRGIVLRAMRGDLDAVKWIADRTEGKVPDHRETNKRVRILVEYVTAAPALASIEARPTPGVDADAHRMLSNGRLDPGTG
jgi:uncharacterized protein DUF5681